MSRPPTILAVDGIAISRCLLLVLTSLIFPNEPTSFAPFLSSCAVRSRLQGDCSEAKLPVIENPETNVVRAAFDWLSLRSAASFWEHVQPRCQLKRVTRRGRSTRCIEASFEDARECGMICATSRSAGSSSSSLN